MTDTHYRLFFCHVIVHRLMFNTHNTKELYEPLAMIKKTTAVQLKLQGCLKDRGPTGGLLLLQCFSGVADATGISRCLNALKLSSPHPYFITVILLILIIAHDDTLIS